MIFFRHIIEIGGTEEDESENIADSTSDSTFLMQTNFPIFENVPYGSWYDAPKYDGNVIAKSNDNLRQFDGKRSFSLEDTKYGDYLK